MGKLSIEKDDKTYEVLYDDEFEDFVASTNWSITVSKTKRDGPYAHATTQPFANWSMHRLFLTMKNGDIPKGLITDHINGNKIDNRLENLRLTTYGGNNKNRGKSSKGRELYKGVRLEHGRYRAGIQSDEKSVFLGYFETAEMAAIAYDIKAKELHGKYAWFNVPNATQEQIDAVRLVMGKSKKKLNARSQYVGVTKNGARGAKREWSAQIYVPTPVRRIEYLGSFHTEREAAIAYNEAALHYRGSNAKLNVL